MKVTVPVGVPLLGATALTVAVNVTDWPKTEGFCEEVSVVVVLAWFTACESAADVLVVKFPSPPYTAVMLCGLPETDKVEVLKVATPDPFSVPVPSVVAPSLKVTVPVGVPLPLPLAATVAVNVTD